MVDQQVQVVRSEHALDISVVESTSSVALIHDEVLTLVSPGEAEMSHVVTTTMVDIHVPQVPALIAAVLLHEEGIRDAFVLLHSDCAIWAQGSAEQHSRSH